MGKIKEFFLIESATDNSTSIKRRIFDQFLIFLWIKDDPNKMNDVVDVGKLDVSGFDHSEEFAKSKGYYGFGHNFSKKEVVGYTIFTKFLILISLALSIGVIAYAMVIVPWRLLNNEISLLYIFISLIVVMGGIKLLYGLWPRLIFLYKNLKRRKL